MGAVRKPVRFNYQDYLCFSEDKRYEIVDGELYMVPAPLIVHQVSLGKLFRLLSEMVEEKKAGKVFIAPVDVVLSDEDIVQPDLLFISNNRLGIITDKYISASPDLVVEILSPFNRHRDLQIKKKLYEKYGVNEYWIVDPEAKSIQIFQMQKEGLQAFRTFTRSMRILSPLFGELAFTADQLF